MAIAAEQLASEIPVRRRRWTRAEFERAEELGLFGPDERLELIGGEILEVTPVNSPHATGFLLVEQSLRPIVPDGFHLRTQLPISIGTSSQPLPDLAIVSGVLRDYAQTHPTSATLVVEVSDTTLPIDRVTKSSLYASAGIPEYWILNLNERLLEVHREPVSAPTEPFGHHYRSITRLTETETVSPLFATKSRISVADLLP